MRVVAVTVLVFLGLLSGAGASASTAGSGVRGIVLRGPTKPVCEVGMSCAQPVPHLTLVFSRSGRVVARAVTGANGRFALALRPGLYGVRSLQKVGFGGKGVLPRFVRVPLGRWVTVRFSIDTGIR